MKKLLLLLLLSSVVSAQNYVDILKVNYGETFKNEFKDHSSDTDIKSFEAEFTLPIPVNESHAIITGVDYFNDELQLYPNADYTRLHNTTLKLGLASQWNEKWSSTIVLLPKLASDYKDISGKDFYMGALASFAMKKNENLSYRFGAYGSTEAYGLYATPIVGLKYLSPNEKLEMDLSLPIKGLVTYDLDQFTLGFDYFGSSRSFRVHQKDDADQYAELSALRFALFAQKNIWKDNVLLRGKLGYATNEYDLYSLDDKIDAKITTYYLGDHRTQLNPEIQGGIFFKVELIYRFHLPKKE